MTRWDLQFQTHFTWENWAVNSNMSVWQVNHIRAIWDACGNRATTKLSIFTMFRSQGVRGAQVACGQDLAGFFVAHIGCGWCAGSSEIEWYLNFMNDNNGEIRTISIKIGLSCPIIWWFLWYHKTNIYCLFQGTYYSGLVLSGWS